MAISSQEPIYEMSMHTRSRAVDYTVHWRLRKTHWSGPIKVQVHFVAFLVPGTWNLEWGPAGSSRPALGHPQYCFPNKQRSLPGRPTRHHSSSGKRREKKVGYLKYLINQVLTPGPGMPSHTSVGCHAMLPLLYLMMFRSVEYDRYAVVGVTHATSV